MNTQEMTETPAEQTTEHIGFIGLGNMGKPMARNLVAAGFPVTVFDRDPVPLSELEQCGASVAASPRELAERSTIVCSVVMNDQQTLDVITGADGVLSGLSPGGLIVLHSTIGIDTCQTIGRLAALQGVSVIDAAVSGAEERSIVGTLSLMVGGTDDDVARARPVLEVVGSEIFHMGELGMGQVTKQCNNLLTLVNLQVVEEALLLACSLGIDEVRMREVAATSTGDSWALRNIDQMRSIAHLYGTDGTMRRFGHKDIALVSKLAEDFDVPIPIATFAFLEPADEIDEAD